MNILTFMMITAGVPGLITLYYIQRVHDTLIFRTIEQVIVVRMLALLYLLPLLCYILYIQFHYDTALFRQVMLVIGVFVIIISIGSCFIYYCFYRNKEKNKGKDHKEKRISSMFFNISEACMIFTLLYATFSLLFCGILDILGYSQLIEFQNVYYVMVEHLMLLTIVLTVMHVSKYIHKKQQETIEDEHLRKTLTKLKVKK